MNDPMTLKQALADFFAHVGLSKASPMAKTCGKKFFVAGVGYALHAMLATADPGRLKEDVEAALDELAESDREHAERN
jgi:hypothetical protein